MWHGDVHVTGATLNCALCLERAEQVHANRPNMVPSHYALRTRVVIVFIAIRCHEWPNEEDLATCRKGLKSRAVTWGFEPRVLRQLLYLRHPVPSGESMRRATMCWTPARDFEYEAR